MAVSGRMPCNKLSYIGGITLSVSSFSAIELWSIYRAVLISTLMSIVELEFFRLKIHIDCISYEGKMTIDENSAYFQITQISS